MTKQDLTTALIKYGLMADIRDNNRVNHFGGVVPIIKDNLIFRPKYNGILNDIPVSLLDSQIISIASIDLNHLLITIA